MLAYLQYLVKHQEVFLALFITPKQGYKYIFFLLRPE